jgi:hypothetical protein
MAMKKTEELLVLPRVKAQLSQYDCVYAMEIHSLVLLFKSGLNLDKVIYFSLESDQIINEYDKKYVTKLLKQCYSCVIQCKERGDDFKRKLQLDVDFQYLPVSLRPVKLIRKIHEESIEQPLKIVYSGFFSEWSCLEEFLTQVANTELLAKSQITLQGHALGTERYFAELVSKFAHYDNIRFNSEFIEDSKFLQFLKEFDIGLAFYNGNKALSNWNNLLYASGKIACYLWAGLAVMTNVDTEATKEPPFIFIDTFCKSNIEQRLHEYNKKNSDYQMAAIEFARRYYNLDGYMYNIFMDTEKRFDG